MYVRPRPAAAASRLARGPGQPKTREGMPAARPPPADTDPPVLRRGTGAGQPGPGSTPPEDPAWALRGRTPKVNPAVSCRQNGGGVRIVEQKTRAVSAPVPKAQKCWPLKAASKPSPPTETAPRDGPRAPSAPARCREKEQLGRSGKGRRGGPIKAIAAAYALTSAASASAGPATKASTGRVEATRPDLSAAPVRRVPPLKNSTKSRPP